MKFVAFYLPQYHEIPENNEWWGNGFTDWVNVKKAKKFFPNHNQPRIPLDDWYYDLSNEEDIIKQIDIAKKYGVYGFCFYHYWFHGKLLLQKPVEIFRQNKNIKFNYCFSWANEPWARTWDGKNREYLIKQEYGDEKDWASHFYYFLPFFKDERYIKIDNMPMLLIYKAASITDFDDMVHCWNDLALKHGFSGVYLVNTLRDNSVNDNKNFLAHVEFEPARSLFPPKMTLWKNRIRRYSVLAYNKIFKKNLLCNPIIPFNKIAKESLSKGNPRNTYGGVFMGWDNTPRKNQLGTIVHQPSRQEFENFVKRKIESVRVNNDENNQFVFINAWNEWAEGTYLEPDTENKYAYLEILSKYSK